MLPQARAERHFIRSGSQVTLGWLDGRMQNRRLGRFSPHLTALAGEDESGAGVTEEILVEQLAYVAFRATADSQFLRPPVEETKRLKIYVGGGKRFTVDAAMPDSTDPVDGFYAWPIDSQGPFGCFFFYSHGINALEDDKPIGEMLVEDGFVSRQELERGIAAQKPRLGDILVEQEKVRPEAIHAAVEAQERRRMRLGEVLIEAGLATAADIELALAEQKKRRGKKIGELLVEMKIVDEGALTATLARKFRIPFVDLEKTTIQPGALAGVPAELIQRYGFLPIASDEQTLTIAISDPLNTEIADVLRFKLSGRRVLEVMATPSQLKSFVKRQLEGGARKVDEILKQMTIEEPVKLEGPAVDELGMKESDSTVIKLANQIIVDAVTRGASDIHIEPRGAESPLIVRLRVDGECEVYQEIPAIYRAPLVARLKILAGLDITERRKPQDGKIRLKVSERLVELRVATIPTVNQNEDMVLRVLAAQKPLPLHEMGLSERNLVELRRVSKSPYGLILCVGPTGSGKTTTLHSLLGELNTPDMKIWTAEDPVEITQEGLRQVQVQPKVGFDFAAAMRAFLRCDPDIIMVGEMRDKETATTAVEASLTGHLVLSTLHTNSAPETVTRLLDMGLDPFSFADALLGVLAQRLARRLCKHCRERYPASANERDELARQGVTLDEVDLWRAPGCDRCGQTGYSGRVALHELLITNDALKQAVQQRASVTELRRLAKETGMTTLLEDGVQKALDGQTDLRQVTAVCSR